MELLLTAASVILLASGSYFTWRFRAFFILHPIKTLKLLPRDGVKQMLLSLGGTVGVGNIAGVSVALALGGSGAVFWMWVGALVAMALKYAEITLGMLFRGGAPIYIKKALGPFFAGLFAVLLIIDAVVMGGMIQSSAVSEAMHTALGLSHLISGVLLSLLAAAVFFFNVDLFRLSSVVVPIMSVGYVVCALAVIFVNAHEIPRVLQNIFTNAFDTDAVTGGTLGFMFTPAMRQGIVKGLFSNEAGCGTAPMAHAASKEKVPAKQGLFGAVEVFVDTILMCTLTAFAILLTDSEAVGGVTACIDAFKTVFGADAPLMLAVAVLLFAFSAIVSFGYYGTECLEYFGAVENGKNAFLLVYCISVFVGATLAPSLAWSIADAVICIMLIVNTSAVVVSRKKILTAHAELYSHIGKYSHKASKTRSFSYGSVKNASPMSDSEINRGSMP